MFVLLKRITCLLMAMTALFLMGCTPVKLPQVSYYQISSQSKSRVGVAKRVKTNKVLLVNDVVASPGFDTAKMQYVNIPYKLKSFAKHRWVAPPATMLLPILVSSLDQLNYFSAVVSTPYVGFADFVLTARLLTLQQEFLSPTSAERMVVSVTIVNSRTHRVVGSRVFQAVSQAPQNDPYSGVLAANKDASIISRGVARFVRHVASKSVL